MVRRSTPWALNSQSNPFRVISSRNFASRTLRSRARWRRASAGPASNRCKNSRWLSDSFSAAESAASSASGVTVTPSVRSALVTSPWRLNAAVLVVWSFGEWLIRRPGVGGFGIVGPLAQQGLIVGSRSQRCWLTLNEPVQVALVVVGESIQRRLGPAPRREDALHGLKAERAVPHGALQRGQHIRAGVDRRQ